MEEVKTETASATVDKSQAKPRPGSAKKSSHARRKRPPKRLSQRPNDVYINRSSQFAGQLSRCQRLFDQGFTEITVHGLGAAIHRAINLALQLRDTSSLPLEIHTTTSTVELVDDLEPLQDDVDYQTQSRPNSAIHIRLSRLPSTQPTPSPTLHPQPSQSTPPQITPPHPSQSTASQPSQHTSTKKTTPKGGKSTGTSKDAVATGKGPPTRTL